MKNWPFCLILPFLISCNQSNIYQVSFENVDGLTSKAFVEINGFPFGKVKDMQLQDNQTILVQVELPKDIKFPSDSKFQMRSRDAFGSKKIVISIGKSSTYLQTDKVIQGIIVKPDSTKNEDEGISFNGFLPLAATDSILLELKKLNERVDAIDRKLGKLK
jgi:hypothetical protein